MSPDRDVGYAPVVRSHDTGQPFSARSELKLGGDKPRPTINQISETTDPGVAWLAIQWWGGRDAHQCGVAPLGGPKVRLNSTSPIQLNPAAPRHHKPLRLAIAHGTPATNT